MRYQHLFLLIILGSVFSCRTRNVEPADEALFTGTFKASEVKEGNVLVYREGATNNIIPGYASYRIALLNENGERKVVLTEFTGERFEGIWTYSSPDQLLTLGALSPQPASITFVYKVESLTQSSLILVNTVPNPKTGQTINRLVLVPE
ncbi:hypothetical protein [Dyadobacter sp. CY323]|uniref:hypothetical protein n=1 Tax=Dyadobacter sp. CY323 TaxID=2907302 RepID=UPI001F3AC29E|nr:hypothetical protein [Dyadobacter sp. CY323]MCE6992970.1 hypothetical protein [Dyadobacter sp. CY323]